MHRKTFRCGVLALFLATTLAPVISATPGSRSPRREVERGFFASAWELLAGLLGGTGSLPDRGLAHLSGANRGGIDPNGLPTEAPPNGCTSCSTDGSGPDPNG